MNDSAIPANREPAAPAPFERLTREAINARPLRMYEGPIHVVDHARDVPRAVAALQREKRLGFDTETRPAFKKGESYPPALLQLAGSKAVYIFRLRQTGLPEDLACLLAAPDKIKAGVAVSRDIHELRTLSDFEPAGFVDLGVVAKRNGIPHHGLRGLAALLLGFRISKSERFTNWDKPVIPARSLTYAATDAWLGRRLYQTMRTMGCKNMDPLRISA